MTANWIGLESKVAVVTGAGGGIGRGIALEFAAAGARTLLLDIDERGAQETADLIATQYGTDVLPVRCDTSDASQIADAACEMRERFGPADVLVNNAGILGDDDLVTTSLESWQRVFAVDLIGYLLCAREFGPDMLERGSGSVVNVSSITGIHPAPGMGAYSTVKAGVHMLTRQMALEWGPRGVRCNAVAPGLIHTPMTDATYAKAAVKSARERAIPLRRIGTAADIANTVLWLASPRSSYVTGQQVLVDGGIGQTTLEILRSEGMR